MLEPVISTGIALAILSGANLTGNINDFDLSYMEEKQQTQSFTGAIYYSGDYAVIHKQYSHNSECGVWEADAYILVHMLGYWARYRDL